MIVTQDEDKTLIVKIKYIPNYRKDGRNWVLTVEKEDRYSYTEDYKFVTKPKGKLLRWHVSRMIKKVSFSKYWDEV